MKYMSLSEMMCGMSLAAGSVAGLMLPLPATAADQASSSSLMQDATRMLRSMGNIQSEIAEDLRVDKGICVPCMLAANGGETSGGSDHVIYSEAFFRSADTNKGISLCYEVNSDFGVPAREIESTMEWAFHEWTQYIQDKDLTYASQGGSPGIVGRISSLKKGCNGSEDLRIYLGVENDEIRRAKRKLNNPYGFVRASTAQTDPSNPKWKKGILWIAGPSSVDVQRKNPTWGSGKPDDKYTAFRFLVLHEIGHVFGNNHMENTIMTSRTAQLLDMDADPSGYMPESYLQIDQALELVPNINKAATFELARDFGCTITDRKSGAMTCPRENALAKSYQRIFGQEPQGQLSARAIRPSNPRAKQGLRPDDTRFGVSPLVIEFTDSTGKVRSVRIDTIAEVAGHADSSPLFNGQHGNHYSSFGTSFSGRLKTHNGTEIPVLVNYNMGRKLKVVDLTDPDGDLNPLFVVVEP